MQVVTTIKRGRVACLRRCESFLRGQSHVVAVILVVAYGGQHEHERQWSNPLNFSLTVQLFMIQAVKLLCDVESVQKVHV